MSSAKCGICQEVSETLKTDMVPCSGICDSLYHLQCAKIGTTVYNAIMRSRQLRFYCDSCSKINTIALVKRIDLLTESMKALVGQFTELSSFIATAVNPIQQVIQPPVFTNPGEVIGCDSTPGGLTAASTETKTFIYVGGLKNSTTKDDVTSYVAAKLDIPETELVCGTLIPRGRQAADLKFIAFKVGVPCTKFERIMTPSLWPVGVIVKKFIQLPSSRRRNVEPPSLTLPHTKND